MSDLATPPALPVAREKTGAAGPTFLRALRGIWLLTWKSQFTWRRLPMQVIGLLVLPFLVYLTIPSSPEEWARRHSVLGAPAQQLNIFAASLVRPHIELTAEQRVQLLQIFQEEFARTEKELYRSDSPETSADRVKAAVQACYGRIGQRIEPVLTEAQFARFENFRQRSVQWSRNRANEPLWNWTAPFYHWLIDFYFFVILPLNCVRLCGGLIRDELQADTLGFLTTRPVSRARLLVAKYLSQTAALQILMLIETLLLFAAGGRRHIPSLGTLLPLFIGTQLLAVFAWSALGTLLGLVSKRYVAVALVYGLIVELGIGRIPTNINTLSVMRHLKTLLAHNPALQSIYEWPGKGAPLSVGALALATGVFLTLAALLFTFVEYHHTAEMQK